MSTPTSPSPAALPIIERARRYLASLPRAVAGEHGHDATFRAACVLTHGFALEEAAAYALLAEWNTHCRPPWTPVQLAHKIRSARQAASARPHGHLLDEPLAAAPAAFPAAPRWPEPEPARTARVIREGPGALELWKKSPTLLDVDDGSNCEEIVGALFTTPAEPDPLLCAGRSSREFATRPLSRWLESGTLPDHSLIVPSPMSAPIGLTKDGRPSEHTLDNTGPRRHLVVEFDTGSADDHAARLWHLGGFAPLVLVVHSGGKSLHGWFACGDSTEEARRRFFVLAVGLGADKATWTRSQFVRLPGGRRTPGGCRQSVFYYAARRIEQLNHTH